MPFAPHADPSGRACVSVLLPTYNRARFLPAAFAAIRSQSLTDWELIVVDDGSTDETQEIVARLKHEVVQPVTYVKQENAGAYAARNTALERSSAPLVAFYDSDDLWLSHHLEHSVRALDENPGVDWVYAACRTVDYGTGHVTVPDTFSVNGAPRPFRRLRTRRCGPLHVIEDDRAVAWAVRHGLYCGLQNSVIRRTVFERARFQDSFRNEAEDQLFAIRALKRGHRLGYLNAVHVQYHVHEANSSASAITQPVDRQLAIYRPLVRGFEELRREFMWTATERRALARRIGRDHFWHIGYSVLWRNRRRAEAIEAYKAGLRAWPWSLSCWKTYLAARARVAVGRPDASLKGAG